MNVMTGMVLAAAIVTVATLVAGISAMATDGEVGHRSSGEWMVARVASQGATLVLLWLTQYM